MERLTSKEKLESHDAMSELGINLESGLGLQNLTATEISYHL